ARVTARKRPRAPARVSAAEGRMPRAGARAAHRHPEMQEDIAALERLHAEITAAPPRLQASEEVGFSGNSVTSITVFARSEWHHAGVAVDVRRVGMTHALQNRPDCIGPDLPQASARDEERKSDNGPAAHGSRVQASRRSARTPLSHLGASALNEKRRDAAPLTSC